MKNKKEGLFIQCIVCSLLPLITLFIPYLKFGISVPLLGKVMEQLTGMDLLKVMGNVNNLANSIQQGKNQPVTNQRLKHFCKIKT